jgi:hypothetical protein
VGRKDVDEELCSHDLDSGRRQAPLTHPEAGELHRPHPEAGDVDRPIPSQASSADRGKGAEQQRSTVAGEGASCRGGVGNWKGRRGWWSRKRGSGILEGRRCPDGGLSPHPAAPPLEAG